MTRPFECLTIMLTNQCPLRCAHCGPRSGPKEKGALDLETVTQALDEARTRSCLMVNFSGGEPFILGQFLTDCVRAAAAREFLPRITTGAYWSATETMSARRLDPLAEAGLRQLFISCSDAHSEFVPFSNIIKATVAARQRDIEVYLTVGTSQTSRTTPHSVYQSFEAAGVSTPWLLNSPIIPYGRAEENMPAAELLMQPVENFAGPCASMTEHPTIQADGRVTGCAVVFAGACARLAYGNVHEEPLGAALDRMNTDMLAAWIHRVGVVELKQLIEANTPLIFPDRYVNICHLCGDLLSHPQVLSFLASSGFGPSDALESTAS